MTARARPMRRCYRCRHEAKRGLELDPDTPGDWWRCLDVKACDHRVWLAKMQRRHPTHIEPEPDPTDSGTGACPAPEKIRYPNGAQARAAVERIRRHGQRRDGKPSRAYPCPCGGWHLTSNGYGEQL